MGSVHNTEQSSEEQPSRQEEMFKKLWYRQSMRQRLWASRAASGSSESSSILFLCPLPMGYGPLYLCAQCNLCFGGSCSYEVQRIFILFLVHQNQTTFGRIKWLLRASQYPFYRMTCKLEFWETEGILKDRNMIPKMFKQQKRGIRAYVMLKSEVEVSRIHDTEMIKSEGLLTEFIKDCGMSLECIF